MHHPILIDTIVHLQYNPQINNANKSGCKVGYHSLSYDVVRVGRSNVQNQMKGPRGLWSDAVRGLYSPKRLQVCRINAMGASGLIYSKIRAK